jgi:hypothetical protein
MTYLILATIPIILLSLYGIIINDDITTGDN